MKKYLFAAAAVFAGLALGTLQGKDADPNDKPPMYITVSGDCVKAPAGRGGFMMSDTKPEVSPASPVPLLSDAQKAYVDMPRKERIAYFADAKKRLEMQSAGYYPLTVTLEAKCKNSAPHGHTYTISEDWDLAPAITITSKAPKDQKIEIGNLKIAKQYYWSVRCDLPGTEQPYSAIRTFTTEDKAPRLVKIDGVPNVRDLGGRIGLNGRRVKQGMIFRTAGLNDNAGTKYKPLEEVLKDPAMKAEYEERTEIVKDCESGIKADKTVDTVPYSIGKTWTLFLPKKALVSLTDHEKFGKLKEIPAEFCGAKAEQITTGEHFCYVLPGKEAYRPSFFIQEFTAEKSGVMQIGVGGDWFFQVWVNGKKEFDLMRDGSLAHPINVSNHVIEIHVKKGKNIIAIPLLSGSASWTFCCGQPTKERTHKRMLEKRMEMEKKVLATFKRVPDGKVAGKNRLNDAMKKYIVEDLGWKSDIDLRSDGECFGMLGSPAGKEVKWFHYSSAAYAGMKSDFGRSAFTKVFKVFLDEKNYPIDFHCIAGQDRTGAVAFILNGLLGVAEEDLYLDWEVTGFWNKSTNFDHAKRFDHLVKYFNELPGKTLNDKIEYYVLSLGFTKDDITKFRSIMLE